MSLSIYVDLSSSLLLSSSTLYCISPPSFCPFLLPPSLPPCSLALHLSCSHSHRLSFSRGPSPFIASLSLSICPSICLSAHQSVHLSLSPTVRTFHVAASCCCHKRGTMLPPLQLHVLSTRLHTNRCDVSHIRSVTLSLSISSKCEILLESTLYSYFQPDSTYSSVCLALPIFPCLFASNLACASLDRPRPLPLCSFCALHLHPCMICACMTTQCMACTSLAFPSAQCQHSFPKIPTNEQEQQHCPASRMCMLQASKQNRIERTTTKFDT